MARINSFNEFINGVEVDNLENNKLLKCHSSNFPDKRVHIRRHKVPTYIRIGKTSDNDEIFEDLSSTKDSNTNSSCNSYANTNSNRLKNSSKCRSSIKSTILDTFFSHTGVDSILSHRFIYKFSDFDIQKIAEGFFSDVFIAIRKDNYETSVIKCLKRPSNSDDLQNLFKEIRILCSLDHENVLKCLGVVCENQKIGILLEYLSCGSLDELLKHDDIIISSWNSRLSISIDIARGLKYLHSHGVIHRDLASKNIFITVNDFSNFIPIKAIIGDFGLSHMFPTESQNGFLVEMVGSPFHMSPEMLNNQPYNHKADIFSYGIILCELIGGVPGADPDEVPRNANYGLDIIEFSNTLEKCPPILLDITVSCCQVDPQLRPTSSRILRKLVPHYNSPVFQNKWSSLRKKISNNSETYSSEQNSTSSNPPSILVMESNSSYADDKSINASSLSHNCSSDDTPLSSMAELSHSKERVLFHVEEMADGTPGRLPFFFNNLLQKYRKNSTDYLVSNQCSKNQKSKPSSKRLFYSTSFKNSSVNETGNEHNLSPLIDPDKLGNNNYNHYATISNKNKGNIVSRLLTKVFPK